MDTIKISILLLILFLAFLVRGFNFGSNPPSLNSDEAAIGYNAYSILKTGKDEYGQSFPLAFRSFDDYKPPLYIYLTVPSVAVFGPTSFGIRLPALILGLLSIVSVFLLVKEVSKKFYLGALAAFLLAISPWHILFSKVAFEAGGLVFLFSLGSYFFLKAKTRPWFYTGALICFALAPFLYQAGKVIAPLLVIILILTNCSKKLLVSILFAIVLLPGFLTLVSSEGSLRYRGLSVLSDPGIESQTTSDRKIDWLRGDNKSALLFHSEIKTAGLKVANNYFSYFRPDFLFLANGDNRLPYVPDTGFLYLIELPLLFIGVYFLWRKTSKNLAIFITLWLVIAPIPASIVIGSPNSIRASLMIVPLYTMIAYGIYYLTKEFSKVSKFVFPILFAISLAFYLHELLIHAPVVNSKTWYYSLEDTVKYTESIKGGYDKIYVSNSIDEPYIFFLLYSAKDPAKYLKQGGTVSGGFKEDRNKFDKYKFVFLDFEKLKKQPNTLIVGTPKDFPNDAVPSKTLNYLNGEPSIFIFQ